MTRKMRAHQSNEASVQAWVFPHLITWLKSQQLDVGAIERLPGLDLTDPDSRVVESTADTAWRLAGTMTGDEAIGLHLAEWLPRGALDLIEYAVRSSASLASGLERLAHYGRLVSDRYAARIERNDGRLLLIVDDVGTSPLQRGRADFALAIAVKLARDVTGAPILPQQVAFAHDHPRDDAEHRRFFRAPLHFSAGANTVLFSAEDAARPLREADAALSAIVRRRLDKLLPTPVASPSTAVSLTARVRRMLVEDLGQATITADSVAKAVAMSRRTLTRRLSAEGTSFRAILDDVRAELARALLQDRSLSVADVAFFLQYSEPAAFHRSFRRWTGQTPQNYRSS